MGLSHGAERSEEGLQVFGFAKVGEIPDEDAPGFHQRVVAVRLQRRRFQLPGSGVAFERVGVTGRGSNRFADLR